MGRRKPRISAQQRCWSRRLCCTRHARLQLWGTFLHGFVVPNSGWIGILVAVAEFVIGIALVLGLFTRIAALGSLAMLFTYVISGTASVCALYALFAIVILAMWRTSSWIGVDGLVAGFRQRHNDRRTSGENVTRTLEFAKAA
jgi:uncharacterized membrane protein YphA (DoxX/SURF4 family)